MAAARLIPLLLGWRHHDLADRPLLPTEHAERRSLDLVAQQRFGYGIEGLPDLPGQLGVPQVQELRLPPKNLCPTKVFGEHVQRVVHRVDLLRLRAIPVKGEEVPGDDVVDAALQVEGSSEERVPVKAEHVLQCFGLVFSAPLGVVGPPPLLNPAARNERYQRGC